MMASVQWDHIVRAELIAAPTVVYVKSEYVMPLQRKTVQEVQTKLASYYVGDNSLISACYFQNDVVT